jgi:type II secretory pathway pseudopilin PulG
MIKLYRLNTKKQAQTIVLVLLYLMIVSVLVSGLIILTLNLNNTQISNTKTSNAKSLAIAKIEQILGADDDLFNPNQTEAINSFSKISVPNTKEILQPNISPQGSVNKEYLGEIIFENAGENENSKVSCSKKSVGVLDRFNLPPYKSFSLDIENSTTINVASVNSEQLMFSIIYTTNGVSNIDKNIVFAVSFNSANGAGTISYNNGQFSYPLIQNDGVDFSSVVYQGLKNSEFYRSDQSSIAINIPSLVNQINASSLMHQGEIVNQIKSINITNVSDNAEDSEISIWGNLPSTIINLKCFAELDFYSVSGTSSSHLIQVYYPSQMGIPNFLDYTLAVGKYADNDGNDTYVLTK